MLFLGERPSWAEYAALALILAALATVIRPRGAIAAQHLRVGSVPGRALRNRHRGAAKRPG
jgi:hypothetical protein